MYDIVSKEKNPKGKYEYGCIMIDLDIPELLEIHSYIKLPDVYFGDNIEQYGLENESHVTLLYGITENNNFEDIEYCVSKINIEEINVKDISCFENEQFDVLKFDVDRSILEQYNNFFKTELDHVESQYDYNPHITIAYLNPGLGGFYKNILSNINYPKTVKIKNISYSSPEGDKYYFYK